MIRFPFDIIFSELSSESGWFAILLKFLFRNVYYLKLRSYDDILLSERLKRFKVLPLPISSLKHISNFADADSDSKGYSWKWLDETLAGIDMNTFSKFFPKIDNLDKKLRLYLLDFVALKQTSIGSKLSFWSENHSQSRSIFVSFDFSDFAIPYFPKNISKVILPLPNISSLFGFAKNVFRIILTKINFKIKSSRKKLEVKSAFQWEKYKVCLVTHAGLSYGKLYEKSLYYSDKHLDFKRENILHFDYSGIDSPSEKIPWWRLKSAKELNLLNFLYSSTSFLISSLAFFSNARRQICFIRLLFVKLKFDAYFIDLEEVKGIKLVLIDYDMLCPKSLLLAFESKGITTVATQERYVFSYFKSATVFLDYYFVGSEESIQVMQNSRNFLIKNYLPVGQYRTDQFFSSESELLRFRNSNSNSKFKILALGFHTWENWYTELVDPLLNWESHFFFLQDMLQLANDLPESDIVLRFKNIDWMNVVKFSRILREIEAKDNIEISEDYTVSFGSYNLGRNADLIIAKYTSLADECLSIGKPVLFHDYSHNMEKIILDTFDYLGSGLVCSSYGEILDKVKKVMSNEPEFMAEIASVSKHLYGNYSDGNVKTRIHSLIKNEIFTNL